MIPAMNEFLATGPFDLYELQLFHLVAEHLNFTRAGRAAGLTQSAITRQIRGMEDRLGISLFERTTRSVRLTSAGAALYARSGAILSGVNEAVSTLKDGFDLAPKALRVGIARTIGLAYLPGFFRRFQTRFPRVQLRVSHESSAFILAAVESGELDIGIVAAPAQLSRALTVTHRFVDEFVAIAPPKLRLSGAVQRVPPIELPRIFARQRWLLISDDTSTGKRLRAWLTRHHLKLETAMEADNFSDREPRLAGAWRQHRATPGAGAPSAESPRSTPQYHPKIRTRLDCRGSPPGEVAEHAGQFRRQHLVLSTSRWPSSSGGGLQSHARGCGSHTGLHFFGHRC
jgi:DNA-binding transcriptional LysR family regulator